MRIAYLGAVEFSQHCLEEVLENGGNVVAVLALPPEASDRHSDYADLGEVARAHDIPVTYTTDANSDEALQALDRVDPDVLFVLGWSEILDEKVLEVPKKGCIGSHPTLLPERRGRHPIIWALVDGLEETGLTFFWLTPSVDDGPILWQDSFSIDLRDDAGDVYRKVKETASRGIEEFLPQLQADEAPRIPQGDVDATHKRRRSFEDGQIDWSDSGMEIYNLVRGLARPYPGAHTWFRGILLKIWSAEPPEAVGPRGSEQSPGTVLERTEEGMTVRTGDGILPVTAYELEDVVDIRAGAQLGSRDDNGRDGDEVVGAETCGR